MEDKTDLLKTVRQHKGTRFECLYKTCALTFEMKTRCR